MKRIFILLGLCLLLGMGTASADLSDGFFCSIKKTEVTISLKQTTGYYKCKDTVVSIEQLMINTAKDLMKIQVYLNRGRDVEYWQTIKIQKKSLLDTLQLSRISINTNMKTFETSLLQKSIKYFLLKINPYKLSLQKSLVKIDLLSGVATSELIVYQKLLQVQVATIDQFLTVTTQQELSLLLAKYVYLKNEITGKYE